MAGLVVALTGIYFTVRLQRVADRAAGSLVKRLVLGDGPATIQLER